jgi:nitroreductase
MRFTKPVSEVIRQRRSWRTYDGASIDGEAKDRLLQFLSSLSSGPLGSVVRIELVDTLDSSSLRTRLMGTYGMISGTRQFLAGAVTNSDKDLEDYGYLFEQAVLFATDLDLSTCWMGGTFNRSTFADKLGLTPHEVLPAVSPVGYPKTRRGFVDFLAHRLIGSKNRKSWDQLFFDGNLENPIAEATAGPYKVPLEMVRLAPSAVNGQPWRIVKTEGQNLFHFYLQRKRTYDRIPGADLQRIDMGIALCHFELTAQELNLRGKWEILQPGEPLPPKTEYVASWVEQHPVGSR